MNMFSDLNEKQKEAVYAPAGPLLIIAGAGSGKTKTLTARLAYLITEKKISPERIIAITFTNKAADEMKLRVKKIIEEHGIIIDKEPFVGTFHSFGAKILREQSVVLGRTKGFTIYDNDDSLRLIKNILKTVGIDPKKHAPAKLMKLFSRIKSELSWTKHRAAIFDEEQTERLLFDAYEKELKKNNAFDFDDLIQKVVSLFELHESIRLEYQNRYDYVLIDEYQDINMAQYALVKILAKEHQNINVVGDDAQSIYAFRFADFRNFLNFEREWRQAKVIVLDQNYRSTKIIIEASSVLISRNAVQKQKTLWTNNHQGDPINIIESDNEFTEADYIVEHAQKKARSGESVGILFRTNAQSRALEQACVEWGVEYNLFGAQSFYERKEIKDCIAVLRYAANPSDSVSFERIKKTFYKNIWKEFESELPKRAKNNSPHVVLKYALDHSNFFLELQKEFENYVDRIENVKELIHFAQQFSSLDELLQKIALASPLDMKRKKREKITAGGLYLMTIHLAKGLEFDSVYIAGVNEGILPHQRSFFSERDMEEERRLMYVAMTRAKKSLAISFYNTPSRFVYEIPPQHTIFKGEKTLDDQERFIEYD